MSIILKPTLFDIGAGRVARFLAAQGIAGEAKWFLYDLCEAAAAFLDRDTFLTKLQRLRQSRDERSMKTVSTDLLLEASARFHRLRNWNELSASTLAPVLEIFPGMFESTNQGRPLGLINGQIRFHPEKLFHNAGWYDATGRRVGFGDLSADDLANVAEGLGKGVFLAVLTERPSIDLERRHLVYEDAPGIEYVADCAEIALGSGVMHLAPNARQGLPEKRLGRRSQVRRVSRADLAEMLGSSVPAITI